jgi:hypothetical protein
MKGAALAEEDAGLRPLSSLALHPASTARKKQALIVAKNNFPRIGRLDRI